MCASITKRGKSNPSSANLLRADTQPIAKQSSGANTQETVSADSMRRNMIAESAYYRAKQRGFEPGYELEDWLAAENEVVRSWLERCPDSLD
jgi:hypothetical protein